MRVCLFSRFRFKLFSSKEDDDAKEISAAFSRFNVSIEISLRAMPFTFSPSSSSRDFCRCFSFRSRAFSAKKLQFAQSISIPVTDEKAPSYVYVRGAIRLQPQSSNCKFKFCSKVENFINLNCCDVFLSRLSSFLEKQNK